MDVLVNCVGGFVLVAIIVGLIHFSIELYKMRD